MLAKLKEYAMRQHLARLLETYGIELKHYLPGRLRVVIRNWHINAEQLFAFAEEMERDPAIHSIAFTKETGSVLIHFAPQAIQDRAVVDRWLRIFQKYTF